MFSLSGKTVFVAGASGMVGSAIIRRLSGTPVKAVLAPARSDLDLLDQAAVHSWMSDKRPDLVIVAAAEVGGIADNQTRPADFIYRNLQISTNLIYAAHETKVEKLVYLGSSCIYPKHADQPISEDALLTGELEPTNEFYAVAKIAGIKLAQGFRRQYGDDFISLMPTNLYGPGDNYDLETSHVLPALIHKAHTAKRSGKSQMVVWGSGNVRREFLHVDDCADAIIHVTQTYSDDTIVNIGCGNDVSIRELAEQVSDVVGFEGELVFDRSRPDGTPRKLLNTSVLTSLGWGPRYGLRDGIEQTYQYFLKHNCLPNGDILNRVSA